MPGAFSHRLDVSDTFDPDAFARLADVEPNHFWFEQRRELLVWAFARYFPHARSFGEIGCGTGFVLAELARQHPDVAFTGIDAYPQGLELARERLPAVVTLRGGNILDFSDEETFDAIGCFDVLEQIPEDALALVRLAQRLKPGGGLMLTVPQHPALWSAADEIGHHQRRYTRPQLKHLLHANGFDCVRVTSFVTLLSPVLWWRRNLALTREGAMNELSPSPLSNRIGHLTLRLERLMIRLGISLPFGGSLLVIATKRSP